jgi:hypothetical protein
MSRQPALLLDRYLELGTVDGAPLRVHDDAGREQRL